MPTSQESFIKIMNDMESARTDIGLSHLSTEKKGYATYIDYRGAHNTQVTFMFGPSDWDVEIIIKRNGRKYAFRDLLQIPSVAQWTKDNKYKQETRDRIIADEVSWFVKLLKFTFDINLGQTKTN
ncbi:MAG: hypothetical protein ACKO96_07440 [Flammeovirgaceae bacterium]